MDFGNPGALFSGLVIGMVGMVLFMWGKRRADFRVLAVGAVMCVYPYFVESVLAQWLIAAGCLGGLYALVKWT